MNRSDSTTAAMQFTDTKREAVETFVGRNGGFLRRLSQATRVSFVVNALLARPGCAVPPEAVEQALADPAVVAEALRILGAVTR